MSKIFKTFLALLLCIFLISNFCYGIDLNLTSNENNSNDTNTTNNESNVSNESSNNTENVNSNNTSTTITTVSPDTSNDGLTLSNILSIAIIVIGFLLVLLSIAILIRLNK